MDFDLTDEHKMIRDMARDFSDEVIAPGAEDMERTGEYPYDIIAQMAELGMMGIPFSEEYGGSGGDWLGMHVCIEEISRGDLTLGALLDVTTMPIRFFPKMVDWRSRYSRHALVEKHRQNF